MPAKGKLFGGERLAQVSLDKFEIGGCETLVVIGGEVRVFQPSFAYGCNALVKGVSYGNMQKRAGQNIAVWGYVEYLLHRPAPVAADIGLEICPYIGSTPGKAVDVFQIIGGQRDVGIVGPAASSYREYDIQQCLKVDRNTYQVTQSR